MINEEWRDVPSVPQLAASSLGRIKRKAFPKRKPSGGFTEQKATNPTYGVLRKSSKAASYAYRGYNYRGLGNVRVHRLVCEAFHGPPPFPDAVVIHLDENSSNNTPDNLAWGTQKENLNSPKFIAYCKSRLGELSPVFKSRLA